MEEVQNRIKDVLWEVARVCYKCNIQPQRDATEDFFSEHRHPFREAAGLAPKGTSGFSSSFVQTAYKPIRMVSGATRSAAANTWDASLCQSLDIILLTAQPAWAGCVCQPD